MNLYVTTDEIKTYLGISGSSSDAVLAMINKFATDDLNGILSVTDLALHKVSGEVHNGGTDRLELRDLHVQAIGDLYEDEDTLYEQDDAYDIDNYVLHLDDGLTGGEREVTIDYVSGWNASGYATITVTDYANLAAAATVILGATPSAGGGTVTRGTDWTAGADNDEEATNLAAAIDALTNVRAFALQNVVYVVDDYQAQATGRTLATSDSVRLAKSASTLAGVDFPEGIRGAVLLLIAGRFAKRKNARVQSYSIGSKSVTFASDADAADFKTAISHYKRAKLHIV